MGRCWWSVVDGLWAYLGAMLAHLGGYVAPGWGLCCSISGLCSPIVRPMLAHVDPSGATGSDQGEEMRRAQNTVKRSSFPALFASGLGLVGRGLCFRVWGWWVGVGRSWLVLCWPPLQAMLAHRGGYVGPFWGYVGPSWGDVGPSWRYVGPSWGYVGPS